MRKKVLVALVLTALTLLAVVFAGPVSSGAMLLMLPSAGPGRHQELPESYRPIHKGYVDHSTGFYTRENDDLVVRSTPPLILRRTYRSGYRVSRQFGIGTTHAGEVWLRGDGQKFQWAELILATGHRISFHRTSPGTSFFNAMYLHRSARREWDGARLGWTGLNWVMRLPDGGVAYFLPCAGPKAYCSITEERDADGHVIRYVRDRNGRLEKMTAEDGWIAFDYDHHDRIVRAYASTTDEVSYHYDERGRLSRASPKAGLYRYTYTERDELETMTETGKMTINKFDPNGRVIHQVTAFDDDPVMYTFTFKYELDGDRVRQSQSERWDGSWSRYEYNAALYVVAETQGAGGSDVRFTYERDPQTNAVTSLRLTCPDRTGRPLQHFSLVRGNEEWIKRDLMQSRCSFKTRRDLGSQ
jgi:YD repeat-containing protein